MVQVELRDSKSIFLAFKASKRSSALSGTKRTFAASPRVAAATARQKSTSKPDQAPLASAIEKPGTPWLTPQIRAPRWRASSSVPAKADEAAPASAASAKAKRRRLGPMAISLKARRLLDDDAGSDRHAVVKIDDVVVDQAEAARRDGVADRLRLIGAVDAIDGLAKVERPRAERIAWPAGHEARQVRLALDHFRRRAPVRPFLLAADLLQSRPLESVAADADPVADRAVFPLDEIKETLGGDDDDRARRLVGPIENDLLFVRAGELLLVRIRHDSRLILDIHVDVGGRGNDGLSRRGGHCCGESQDQSGE